MNILLITLVLLKESIILEIMLQESSSSLYSFPWVAGPGIFCTFCSLRILEV